jgi:uncharacterized membrane protein
VIATKTDSGKIKLNQLMNITAAGAVSGSFWGMLIGLLFLNPLVGAAIGAASGAVGGVVLKTSLDETKELVLRDALQRASADQENGAPASPAAT